MWQVILENIGYNSRVVILGCFMLGLASGAVGSFLFLRRRAMVSDALSHATLPGLVLAFLLIEYLPFIQYSLFVLLLGAALTGGLAAWLIHWISHKTILREDAAIGSILSIFFGVGVVLLTLVQNLSTDHSLHIMHFIYGQAASLNFEDVKMIALVSIIVLMLLLFFFKELMLVAFQPEFGAVQHWPVHFFDFLLLGLVSAVMLIGLQTVGIILMIALLIIPAVAARFWTNELKKMTLLAALFGGFSASIGAVISTLYADIPTGAMIVLIASFFFSFSFFFAPNRGIVMLLWRRRENHDLTA